MSDPELERLVAQWRRFAQEDLESATWMLRVRDHNTPRHAAFAPQQAAEKAIKAVLVARQIDFPFVHDLTRRLSLLRPEDSVVTARRDASWLSRWAMEFRYQGEEEAEWTDAEQAVAEARAIVAAVERDLEASP
jgi:HEPN domain-containing protein